MDIQTNDDGHASATLVGVRQRMVARQLFRQKTIHPEWNVGAWGAPLSPAITFTKLQEPMHHHIIDHRTGQVWNGGLQIGCVERWIGILVRFV